MSPPPPIFHTPPRAGETPPRLQTGGTLVNIKSISSHNATEPTSSPPSQNGQKLQLRATYFGLWTLSVH